MPITRRQFLKRSALSAAALSVGPRFRWVPGTNVSYASGPSDAIVVFVRQYGGNDGINTVYPLNGTQRSNYDDFRPTLGLPATNAGCASRAAQWASQSPGNPAGYGSSTLLSIGTNADGSQYALHPAMNALHSLYTANKVAVVNGVHYPYADHSHFRSEVIWYTVDPLGTAGLGWFGQYLNKAGFAPSAVPCAMLESDVVPLFSPTNTSVFAFNSLGELRFPARNERTEKQQAFSDLYTESAGRGALYPELVTLGNTGVATIDNIALYYQPGDAMGKVEALLVDNPCPAPGEHPTYDSDNPLVYSSPLNPTDNPSVAGMGLARDLRHVAAIIRANVGARFFHVSTGGFDSHANQEEGFYHSYLLQEVSECIAAFYNEMNQSVSLPGCLSGYQTGNLANKVVIVTFTEFGRTIRQNAYGANQAGTDHATSTPQFVVGGSVIGGQYGAYPQLDDPGENEDDLKMTYDFRDFFGTILVRWLGVLVSDLGPGAGKIFPATSVPDGLGYSYTTFTPIGFLPP